MLQIQHICKQYKTGSLVQKALDDVSLNLRDNEFVAILGPSGSGKTTLLNIIGGLDRYDQGDLIINGISTKKYKDRDWDSYRNHTIGFVFQSYNLIPHQTVLSNVELALTISGIGKTERRERAKKALEQVGLGEQLHKKPNQMSGGQMQRVAIARALVNDPDILLADEPTGALDSETSIQVMELLQEVAKDRLVVMVTHNPELADEYATRIVKLKDGKIRSDSDPFIVDEHQMDEPKHQNMGKASMSFLTALSLSFNNLRTKKARTLLTSFAGSIGIIGIALILSLSTGVNQYIQSVEEETLSEYPLQIQSTGFDVTSMLNIGSSGSGDASSKEDGEIEVSEMVTNMFSTMDTNDLSSLKAFLESGESDIEKYSNAIEYSYLATPQIYRKDGDGIRQVHPDKSLAALGISSENSSNSIISSMMSTNMFYEMPENTSLYEHNYDVKAGRWPENYNECVVVLSQQGGVSDFLLYLLGLRDSAELDDMVRQFLNEENVTAPESTETYNSEDFLGITFQLVNSCDYYEYDKEYQVWKDKSDNEEYMKQLVENGEEIRIVGVVQPKEDAKASSLMMGIAYPTSLTKHVAEQAAESEIVKQQLSKPNVDVFTNETFGEESQTEPFDMNSLFTINEEALQEAFVFDESKISMDAFGNLDFSALFQDAFQSLDLSKLPITIPEIPAPDYGQIIEEFVPTIPQDQMEQLGRQLFEGFQSYLTDNEFTDPTKMGEYFVSYLETEEAQTLLKESLTGAIDLEQLEQKISDYMQSYTEQIMNQLTSEITKVIQEQMAAATSQIAPKIQEEMERAMAQTMEQMGNAFSIHTDAFANAFEMNMTEEDLKELLMSMGVSENATYEGNLKKLNYVDFDDPSGIDIYPMDFESKEKIVEILDDYNARMEAEGKEEQVISYTDMVGTLMSSVTDIIDTISYVLIAFVAISLIVSSIMIGVITYISVLERKKEIGILRAIGASKGNISQVFNAETFIIGLCAGLIGIGITLLILIPANMLIHYIAGNEDVSAVLPVVPALILIALSIGLTLLGGLIPSRTAAKSDPVAALRTE